MPITTPHWPIPLGHKPIDLGLSRVREALTKLGNPEKQLPPVVHIAGTNGKGSTLAFLKSILEHAGLKVHRYTSPHLVYFNERIELAGQPIGDEALHDALERTRIATDGIPLTFFEGTTIAAILAFSQKPADITLLETGMGGRLDATNIIDHPLLTLISPISLDHQSFLGETLAEIAFEKASIMKPGSTCISAPQHTEVMEVLRAHADEHNIDLSISNPIAPTTPLSLLGEHQYINAGLAKTAAILISDQLQLHITEQCIADGLKTAHWPARLQNISDHPLAKTYLDAGDHLILDGGHNEDAAKAIAHFLQSEQIPTEQCAIILGMLNGKDHGGFLNALNHSVHHIATIPIVDEDSISPTELANLAKQRCYQVSHHSSLEDACRHVVAQIAPPRTLIVAGSLYLAGQVLAKS